MRHDAIHPMACACDRCFDAAPARLADRMTGPDELSALRKGAIAALWLTGTLAASKVGLSVVDWMTAR
ncbi:MAG: hypothetical protein U9R64_12355 [Pseudomonadota bacterium]|nr:hypothetical protein [Pseudomonadota bacterium]